MSFNRERRGGQRKLLSPRHILSFVALLSSIAIMAGIAQAQVPSDIEVQLKNIGQVVDGGCTGKLYRPFMPKNDITSSVIPLYPGITIARDVSFGPNPKDVVDIFTADKGPASRPVVIYLPGGNGNKIELQDKEANAFFDNIGRWATENGMVGVIMQRHGQAPGAPPDFYAGAKDVSAMLQWVEANISQYRGNPDRTFIWAHSAGNGPLGIYAGHPELYGPKGIGVKGIVFMSGQFDILRPDGTNPVQRTVGTVSNAPPRGSTCGVDDDATAGALPGRQIGQPGGPNAPGERGGGPKVAQDELIKRSSLPALEKTDIRIFLASAELDPGIPDGKPSAFNQALHDELCKLDGPNAVDGTGHCPILVVEKGHSHMSEVFSIDSPDKTVSGPILAWMKSIK